MPRGVTVDAVMFRKLREARGFSQGKLGERAGLTQATISHIETGRPTTFDSIERAAKVLGVQPDWLLSTQVKDVLLGNYGESSVAIDLSDDSGVAYMERVEAGAVEELEEDEELFFELLAKYRAKPNNGDLEWSVEGYERNLSQGLAALSRRDREAGAESIQRVLRRMREAFMEGGKE